MSGESEKGREAIEEDKRTRYTLAQENGVRSVALRFLLVCLWMFVNPISIVSWKRLGENLLLGAYKGQ